MTSSWMESGPGLAALAVLVTGLVTAVSVRPLLAWLPEPAEPGDKPAYRELGTHRFVIGTSAVAAAAAAVTWTVVPLAVQPLWTVLNTLGVLLAAIDGRTTWLPLRLTRVAWVSMLAATLTTAGLTADPVVLLRCAVGAGVAGGLFGLVWLVSRGGFGFGDVRFVPLVGAAAAATSTQHLVYALLLGSVAGAGHGLLRLARSRPGGFPYAPSLLAGAYLAIVVVGLS